MMRRVLVVVAVLVLLVGGVYRWKNPERVTLDGEQRAGLPGQLVASSVGTTYYEAAGPDSGRVVVLVHGFSVPSYIWDSTFAALAGAGMRVIRYDLIGRGWSDRPDLAYAPEEYRAQLGELLDSLRIGGPVDLMGLSFGGAVVADFAARYPARVRTLTMLDPMTRTDGTIPARMRWPVIGPYLWQVTVVPTLADGQPGDFLQPERFPDWADRYRPQQRYRGFGRALRRTRLNMGALDLAAAYDAIAARGTPVLLVWGREDRVTPITSAPDVTSRIRSTEFVAVDSAGHLPHLEQASRVNARLLEFLARHAVGPQ